ncbi:hypothetical protein LSTR_LSTR005401 [Laodelphax striatellus]|uniref:HTH psq-type domain-containing protein n=1 Tax=Laodelphax striatellus TaxID=195883 RepID=A0A482WRA3_LAOST|nr:hypothetical protein LSTR_LSTR005401 [Laodelphax striatellus]
MSAKKKNISLSISDKKRVIKAVEDGQPKKDVAKQFGILPSTLSMILKNKDRINASDSSVCKKRSRQGEFPRLEECLLKWIRQCRGQNIPIGGFMLKEKAKSFLLLLRTTMYKLLIPLHYRHAPIAYCKLTHKNDGQLSTSVGWKVRRKVQALASHSLQEAHKRLRSEKWKYLLAVGKLESSTTLIAQRLLTQSA